MRRSRPLRVGAILLAAATALAPLTASATSAPRLPAGYRTRALAPSRTLSTPPAQPRLRARISAAPLTLGPGVSPNFAVSPPGRDAFETTTVATDPGFHRSVFVSAEDQSTGAIAGFASGDAGGSWSASPLPSPTAGPQAFLAFPSAGFDSADNLYESYVGFAVNGASVASQLVVARSADRGHSWASPTIVEGSNIPDRPQLAIDTTGGTFKNRVYVAYNTNPGKTSSGNYSQPLYLAHSDGGAAWTKTQVWDTGGDHEGFPSVGPNGEVYVAWTDYCGSYSPNPSGADCLSTSRTVLLRVARSDDGGAGFQLNPGINAGRIADLGTTFPYTMPNYSNNCGGSGPTPIEPSPSIAVDRSGGPYQGTVYAVFTTKNTASAHVYLAKSTDRGLNWSRYVQLDSGNLNTDAWGPALAVDQSNGAVTVAWYDRRDDGNNKLYRVYYTQSIDGGQTFLPNQIVVSDRQADPTVDCLATGTYTQMRAADGMAQPFWTDTDSGSIVSALISERSNYLAPTRIFGSPTAYAVPTASSGVSGIVTGDFNGDGKLDLAVLSNNLSSAAISIYLGNGDGTFTAGQVIALTSTPNTSSPRAIVSADFDGDGKTDLAVSGQRCDPTLCPDVVWFLRGVGDGTFQTPTYKAVGGVGYANTIAVGTFVTGGKPDLVLDNGDQVSMSILRNTSTAGSISFSDPIVLNVAGRNPVVADFNGDNKFDIAFTHVDSTTGVGYVGILLGNGDGTFQAPCTNVAVNPSTLATADLNRDGKPDLVSSTSVGLMIMLGNGDGSFTTHLQSSIGGFMVIQDVTGDGIPDILMDCGDAYRAICTMVGKGDGTFGSPIISTYSGTGYATNGIAVGDFNGDRKADVAVTQNGRQSFNVLLHIGDRLSATSRVSFGAVSLGQSLTGPAVFTNNGTSDLPVSFVSTESPDFSIVNDPCSGSTLAAGASCTVTIRFTPAILQPETANLTTIGDALRTTLTVPLDGMGDRGIAPPAPSRPFPPRTAPGSSAVTTRGPDAQPVRTPTRAAPSPNLEAVMAQITAALLNFLGS